MIGRARIVWKKDFIIYTFSKERREKKHTHFVIKDKLLNQKPENS